MSLTSFMKVKGRNAWFKENVPIKMNKIDGELLAPPITKRYSMIGTAFDYLLRFHIEKLNPKASTSKWIAEKSVDNLKNMPSEWAPILTNSEYSEKQPAEDWKFAIAQSKRVVGAAKNNLSKFIKGGKLTDDLIKSSVDLARLDPFFRVPIGYDFNIETYGDGDIQDLKNLSNLIDSDIFKVKERCFLNPEFGVYSVYIGGADADLIIDDMLIDVKTTKNPTVSRPYFNQVLGYYMLACKGGIGRSTKYDLKNPSPVNDPQINKLGIYFSRFGKLVTWDVQDIKASSSDFDKFYNEFHDMIKKQYKQSKKFNLS